MRQGPLHSPEAAAHTDDMTAAAVEGDEEPPQAQRQLQTHTSTSRRSGCWRAMAVVREDDGLMARPPSSFI